MDDGDDMSIDTVRRGVAELATSEKLDKESALALTRRFHAMEMLRRHACTERDVRVAEKDAELQRLRLEVELARVQAQAQTQAQTPRDSAPRAKMSRW